MLMKNLVFFLLVVILSFAQKKTCVAEKQQEATNYTIDAKEYLRELNLSGLDYWSRGNFEGAMKEYRKMLKLSEFTENYFYQAMALSNIGFIYAECENYEKCIEYRMKALLLRKKINDIQGIGLSYNSLGLTYYALDSLGQALNFYEQALPLLQDIGDSLGESNVLNNIGNVYAKQSQFLLAKQYHDAALKIRIKRNDKRGLAESYKNLSNLYIKTGEYSLAIDLIKKGILIAEEIKSDKLRKFFYYQQYLLSQARGDYLLALDSYICFSEIKDSLVSLEKIKIIDELEIQYKTEKKEQEIQLLHVSNLLKEEEIEKKSMSFRWLFGIMLLFLLMLLLLLYMYFQKRRAYKTLVRMNIEVAKCDNIKEQEKKKENRHKQSKLDEGEKQKLLDNLNQLMINEKPFLQKTCSIDELAKKLSSNRQYLSQLINKHFEKNFNNYINEYRIREARVLLVDKEHDKYTIEGVSKIVGFNSRTSFIAAFKRYTGVTPSFFKSTYKNSL